MGFVSLLAKTFTGCRYMLAVRDVYPDALYSAGILGEGSIFYRFLDHLLKISMNHAEKVLTLGRDMSQRIKEKRVPGEKIEEVPNWGLEKLHPLDKEENYMVREMGLEGKFVILYSGNFGYAHEFDTVLAGCRQLSEKYNNMHFIFIGRGKRLGEIKKFFEWNKDIDCSILDYLPLEKLNYSLNIADVTLVTMREGWDGVAIPSKTYSQMAVGKPIIYVGPENDISRTLENVHCGYSVRNGDVGSFIKRVSELYKDRTLRERMGKNARLAYEKKYNRERAIEQYVKIFRESFL